MHLDFTFVNYIFLLVLVIAMLMLANHVILSQIEEKRGIEERERKDSGEKKKRAGTQ